MIVDSCEATLSLPNAPASSQRVSNLQFFTLDKMPLCWPLPPLPHGPPGSPCLCWVTLTFQIIHPLSQKPSQDDPVSLLQKDSFRSMENILHFAPAKQLSLCFLAISAIDSSLRTLTCEFLCPSNSMQLTSSPPSGSFETYSLTWGRRVTLRPWRDVSYTHNPSEKIQTPRFSTSLSLNILLSTIDRYLVATGLELHGIDWYFSKWIIQWQLPAAFDSTCISVKMFWL